MNAAIRPTAMKTHTMFALLSKSAKSGASRIELTPDSLADLLSEFN